MILVYTGNGKGKTSACAGQALRALGQGLEVRFAQFIKQDVGAGEQRLLRRLLGEGFFPGGEGFFCARKPGPPIAAPPNGRWPGAARPCPKAAC